MDSNGGCDVLPPRDADHTAMQSTITGVIKISIVRVHNPRLRIEKMEKKQTKPYRNSVTYA